MEEKYSSVIGVPDFKPNGENIELRNCINTTKYVSLVNKINASTLSEEEKKFLRLAATRFIQFRYDNVAQYFCTKASEEMQKLLQQTAMVLIDFDDAIECGITDAQNFVYSIAKEKFENDNRWDFDEDYPLCLDKDE